MRVLQQKNALLRHSANGQERPYAEKRTLLEVLNTELAAQGEALQQRRREYLKLLAPRACANYAELSHGAERMSIRYAAQFAPGGLADLLRQRQEEELRAGQSLCGIHREDLELLLDDQPARVYASQGQQRRLAVLSVLAGGQKLLLLDEPTYGQDYRSARALMDQVCARVKEDGLTVIMTTHDRGLAEAYADVRYQMRGKKLIREDGSK